MTTSEYKAAIEEQLRAVAKYSQSYGERSMALDGPEETIDYTDKTIHEAEAAILAATKEWVESEVIDKDEPLKDWLAKSDPAAARNLQRAQQRDITKGLVE